MKSLSILCLLVMGIANASEMPLPSLTIYRKDNKPETLELSSIDRFKTIRSKTPHRQLNPEGKTSEFQGVDVVELLRLTNADRSSLVHFVGVDGYTSVVPVSVLLNTGAILAIKQEGRILAA